MAEMAFERTQTTPEDELAQLPMTRPEFDPSKPVTEQLMALFCGPVSPLSSRELAEAAHVIPMIEAIEAEEYRY